MKKFSTALLIYSGPLAYEFMHHNMPQAFPSLRTVQNIIQLEYSMIHEGVFRFNKLLEHVKLHKSSTYVSIAEDATRIISRVDYDPKTNRCVGFVLPVGQDGLPLIDSFLAVSFNAIESMFMQFYISQVCLRIYGTATYFKNTSILSLLHGNRQQIFCSGGHEKVAVHCNRV